MAQYRVWTGLDLTVQIYRCSSEGARMDIDGNERQDAAALTDYCLFRRADIVSDLAIARRAVTGRRFRRVSAQQHEYEMRVDFFYLRKSHDIDMNHIFNRDYYLEIVMKYENEAAPVGSDYDETELHTMSICKGDWRLSAEENGVAQGSARFQGEYFV